jgi:hypothetical protein
MGIDIFMSAQSLATSSYKTTFRESGTIVTSPGHGIGYALLLIHQKEDSHTHISPRTHARTPARTS